MAKAIPLQQGPAYPPLDEGMMRRKYGIVWRPTWNRQGLAAPIEVWERELIMCRNAADGLLPPLEKTPRGSLGFEYHFKELVRALFGDPSGHWHFTWNPNAERMLTNFLRHRRLGILGHASSGKTVFLSVLAVTLFLIYDKRVKIIVTSTTLGASAGKFWGEIKNCWGTLIQFFGDEKKLPGRLLKSANIIQYDCNGMEDTTAGIQLIASEIGSDKDSAEKIQGYKASLLIMLADELDTLHESLMETIRTNLAANKRARFCGAFNPTKWLTVAGRFVTPAAGRASVNAEGPMEWQTETGYAIRFDAYQSPNIVEGYEKWEGLLDPEGLQNIINDSGGENTPGFWRNVRAFFSPIGVAQTVHDETEMVMYKVFEKETAWINPPALAAGLDTGNSAGGDKNVLTIGKVGDVQRRTPDNKTIILRVAEVVKRIVIAHNMKDATPPEEQLVRNLKAILDGQDPRWHPPANCEPLTIGNVALDITGGSNVAPLILRDIGQFHPVNFKSKPSERTLSQTEKSPAKEKFANKRAEMYSIRPLIRSEQLRGIPPEAAAQMCATEYKDTLGSGLIQVEDKEDLKKRIKRSPDDADSYVLFVEVARAKFGLTSQEKAKPTLRPGFRIETGKEFNGTDYVNVHFQVPIIPTEERLQMERWMTPEQKKRFARVHGPSPAPAGAGDQYAQVTYGGGTFEDDWPVMI